MKITLRDLHKAGYRVKNGVAIRTQATEARKPGSKVDVVFDSKLERDFAQHLRYLIAAGEVSGFIHHPPPVAITKVNRYTPDFLIGWKDGRIEFAEVKGIVREDDTLKCRLVKEICPAVGVVMWRRVRGSWVRREF